MGSALHIRVADPADAAALAHIFYRGVHEGAAPAYTPEQRHAWAPKKPDAAGFLKRLDGLITIVAERDTVIQGFMSLRLDGYLDFAYVLPDARGSDVADTLYDAILAEAKRLGLTRLTSEASYLARSFFTRHGWYTDAAQDIEQGGVTLRNFRMSIDL